MGSTSPYAFPYPELTDAPNVASDMQDLAVAVNTEIVRVDGDITTAQATADAVAAQADTHEIRFFAKDGTIAALGSGAWTAVSFTTEVKDTNNGHSTSTNTSRYTCQVAGSYELYGGHRFASNSTGSRGARFSKNGTVITSTDNLIPTTPSGQMALPAKTTQVDLIVGDYVELEAWHNSGSTIAVDAASFGVRYLGPA